MTTTLVPGELSDFKILNNFVSPNAVCHFDLLDPNARSLPPSEASFFSPPLPLSRLSPPVPNISSLFMDAFNLVPLYGSLYGCSFLFMDLFMDARSSLWMPLFMDAFNLVQGKVSFFRSMDQRFLPFPLTALYGCFQLRFPS